MALSFCVKCQVCQFVLPYNIIIHVTSTLQAFYSHAHIHIYKKNIVHVILYTKNKKKEKLKRITGTTYAGNTTLPVKSSKKIIEKGKFECTGIV